MISLRSGSKKCRPPPFSDSLSAIVDPQLLQGGISDSSSFFQLKAIVQIDTVRVSLFTILYRDAQGNVTPVLRSLGTI